MNNTRKENPSLYNLFLMVAIIFITVTFVQFATDINVSTVNTEAYRILKNLASNQKRFQPYFQNGGKAAQDVPLVRMFTERKHESKSRNISRDEHLLEDDKIMEVRKPQDKTHDLKQNGTKTNLTKNSVDISETLSKGVFVNGSDNYLNQQQHNFNGSDGVKTEKKRVKGAKRHNYCLLWPIDLVGHLAEQSFLNTTTIPDSTLTNIHKGGSFKPKDCVPRERTAVIILYRDREKSLKALLRHLHVILQRQKIEYAVYVTELVNTVPFNRGLLANVGFLTASSLAPYTCYVIHDVDLLMTDDRNMYRCGRVPRHLMATLSGEKLQYLSYFGGVTAFTPDQFWKVNGYSNLYFGSTGEADDMVTRIFSTGLHFSRPKPLIGGFVSTSKDESFERMADSQRSSLLNTSAERMTKDGVKSAVYYRLALEEKELYTWIYVGVKEEKIMEISCMTPETVKWCFVVLGKALGLDSDLRNVEDWGQAIVRAETNIGIPNIRLLNCLDMSRYI